MPAGMRPVMPPLPNGGALVSAISSCPARALLCCRHLGANIAGMHSCCSMPCYKSRTWLQVDASCSAAPGASQCTGSRLSAGARSQDGPDQLGLAPQHHTPHVPHLPTPQVPMDGPLHPPHMPPHPHHHDGPRPPLPPTAIAGAGAAAAAGGPAAVPMLGPPPMGPAGPWPPQGPPGLPPGPATSAGASAALGRKGKRGQEGLGDVEGGPSSSRRRLQPGGPSEGEAAAQGWEGREVRGCQGWQWAAWSGALAWPGWARAADACGAAWGLCSHTLATRGASAQDAALSKQDTCAMLLM
jgi:hypothetical protein